MPTRILDLPVASFSMTIGNNEDWTDGLGAYVDANGVAIPFDGIGLNFQMRPAAAGGFTAPLNASTGAKVAGMPVSGRVLVAGNVVALSVPLVVMQRVTPDLYAAELQAQGDGLTRTIGRYAVTVVAGVLR